MARDTADPPPAATADDAERLLLVWLSPSFPVGAYAYSHGLEAAAARGLVTSRRDLESWIGALIQHGSIRNDVILLAAAWRAATRATGLAAINALALALQPSAERHLEITQQGDAFHAAAAAAWPCAALADLRRQVHGPIAYPIAIGVAAAGHGLALRPAAHAFALAFVQNLVSASIRLTLIGQTDGQRVIAGLMPALDRLADQAAHLTLDDIASSTLSADLASLEHETLYSRLFRS